MEVMGESYIRGGPRNSHTLRTKLLKQFCSSKYGYIMREIIGRTDLFQTEQDELESIQQDMLNYVDDGLHIADNPAGFGLFARFQHNFILHSLNKRKRWEIPEKVKGKVDLLAEEDLRVVVYERKTPSSIIFPHDIMSRRSDCISYTDTKGVEEKIITPRHRSHMTDLRRRSTNTIPDQRKKPRWKYHNQHFRDLQRKLPKYPRNGSPENPEANLNSMSLLDGADNPASQMELRYEVAYPDKINPRLNKVPHNWGNYSIEGKVKHYWWYKWDQGRQKALKKTKSCKNKPLSQRFLGSSSPHQIKEDLKCYETMRGPDLDDLDDTVRTCQCINSTEGVSYCCCTCNWDWSDYCSCYGDYGYGDICSCHYNHRRNIRNDENLAKFDTDLPIHICSNKKKSPKRKRSAKKRQTHLDIETKHHGHPNRAKSDKVWCFGKGTAIYYTEDGDDSNRSDILSNKSPHPSNQSDTDDDVKSSRVSEISDADSGIDNSEEGRPIKNTQTKHVDCHIKRLGILHTILSGRCKTGQSLPYRLMCNFTEEGVGHDFSVLLTEKFISHKDVAEIGEYMVRFHADVSTVVLDTAVNNLYQSIHEDNLEVFRVDEVLNLAKEAFRNSLKTESLGKSDYQTDLNHPAYSRLDVIHSFTSSRHASQIQINSVREAYNQLEIKQNIKASESFVPMWMKDTDELLCEVCISQLEEGIESTILLPCQHTFCNECLTHYILERIQNGASKIECMEYKCENTVDEITILSLIPSHTYEKWQERKRENAIEMSGKWKWCPNKKCKKVASLQKETSSLSNVSVRCECSTTWCLHCQAEAHWPSTCKQAENYAKLLKQNGDFDGADESAVVYVKVKKCPSCNHPMEKNGGCSHMMCRCGKSFCWECLKDWNSHYQQGYNMQCSRKVDETVIELSNRRLFSLPIQFYLCSVRSRKRHLGLCNTVLSSEAWRIVDKFDLRESIFIGAGRRKVWGEGVQIRRQNLHDDIIDQLILVRECHKFVEYVYVVASHSTRRMKLRFAVHDLALRMEFILNKIDQITRSSVSPEDIARRERLKSVLQVQMKELVARTLGLQRTIIKKNFTPPLIKDPKSDHLRYQ